MPVWPVWQFTGASPFARPQAADQYNRTSLDAQQRAPSPNATSMVGCLAGSGGSGERVYTPSGKTAVTRRHDSVAFNIYCYGSATLRQQVHDVIVSEVD